MIDTNQQVRELAHEVRLQRQQDINEVSNLTYAIKETQDQHLRTRMMEAIDIVLNRLYPETLGLTNELTSRYKSGIDPFHTEETAPPEVYVLKTAPDEHIDKACTEDISWDWDNIIERKFYVGAKLARRKWDNKFNQEYISWDISRGFTKYYKTASLDGYYKNVEHTYRATEEDKQATDWYIL